ncbi:MAG TPA: ABC transporter ATP-binding protein [Spirochaetia bacterium]|nr:ABC transporter ATP-binding protein [Spirochaetia bacterium]
MKLLLAYIRPYRWMVILAVGLAAVNQVFSLLDPQIFRIIVDQYATKLSGMPRAQFIQGVALLILAFVGVAMVSRIAKNFQDYYVNVISQSVGANMYADGIAHSLRLPYRAFEDQQSGAVLQQLQKARTDSRDMIGQAINSVFLSGLTLLLVLGYSLFVHWSIAVSLLILAPILGVLVSSLGRRIKKVQARIFGETNALAGSTTESLRNIELIKSLGLETQEIDRLNATNQKILDLELAKVKTVRMLMFFQGTAINFFRALFLLQMLILVYLKLITLGEFFSMLFYSFAIFSPLGEFGNVITKYAETRASLDNVQKILAQEPAPRNPGGIVPDGIESLEFAGVTYRHPGAREAALSDVSFQARSGESVAFVGPSGAGKSTLIKLLLGLYAPDQGTILFNGVESGRINYDLLRTHVGFVPQSIELFAGTIRDNLVFARQGATDTECMEALEAAQLRGLLERSREGLATRIGEGGLKLSGGERQRLAIARALLRRPDILIFDEATSSLDTETEREITRTINGIIETRPSFVTLLIAHRLSTIAGADRIVVLKKGRVAEQGSHLELLGAAGLYATLWRQQGLEHDEDGDGVRSAAAQG